MTQKAFRSDQNKLGSHILFNGFECGDRFEKCNNGMGDSFHAFRSVPILIAVRFEPAQFQKSLRRNNCVIIHV
jgi:hypothetical protein